MEMAGTLYIFCILLSLVVGESEMPLRFKIRPLVYSHENPITRCRHIHTHAELLVLSSLVIVVFNKSCLVSGKHWQDGGVVSCIC